MGDFYGNIAAVLCYLCYWFWNILKQISLCLVLIIQCKQVSCARCLLWAFILGNIWIHSHIFYLIDFGILYHTLYLVWGYWAAAANVFFRQEVYRNPGILHLNLMLTNNKSVLHFSLPILWTFGITSVVTAQSNCMKQFGQR